MILSIIFVALAAACNAVCDTITHHFSTSRFKKLNPNFWNPSISWMNAKKIGGYKIDAWHLFKSAWIILFTLASVFYLRSWGVIWDTGILGLVWIISFNIWYNKILKA